MRRLIAIALVAGAAASAQAQRVTPIGPTAPVASVDSPMAPLPLPNQELLLRPPMPSHIAFALPSASLATVDDGRHGTAWKWVVLGALVGGVVGGSVEKNDTGRAEYAVPLAVVLG